MRLPTSPARLLIAATAALVLAGCSSKPERIESGLKKGAEFVRLSDWDKATVEVRNVLQIDPKNARAYYLAARASEGQHEPQRAYAQYLKSLELQPDLLEAKVALARLYLFTGDSARAQSTVNEVLAADAGNAVARTLQAALLARQGKAEEALALARSVLAAAPGGNVDASMVLAGLLASRKEWTQALAVIDSALQHDPRNLGLLQAAADVAASDPKDTALADRAVGYYKRGAAESPKNRDLWLAWARHHIGRHETDRAEAVLREAVRAQPDDTQRRSDLYEFLLAFRGAEVAEKEYQAAIAARPRDMALRFGLADLYRGANRHAEAQKVLGEIVDQGQDAPDTLKARTQIAAYRLAAGKQAEAGTLVGQVLKANPRDNAALVLRSRISLLDGRPHDAVIDLRAALRDQPGAVEVVQLLAQAHGAAGEPQLAREVLAEAVKFRPADADLRAMLAADLADAKDYIGAHAELDTGIRLSPGAGRLYQLKAEVALAQKDTAGAVKTLEQLKARQPREAAAYLSLAQIYAGQHKYDAALKEYDAAAAAQPGNPAPYVAGIGLLTLQKKFDEANARIQPRLKAEPGNILHLQLKGDVAMARRDYAGAEQAYRAAISALPAAPMGYINAAKAVAARGDSAAAWAVLAEGEKAAPGERSIPLTRADWLTRAHRYDEAIAAYESLHGRYPDDDTVANNLAYLLLESKGDKASAEQALTLLSRFADSRNPGYLDSLGWAHYRLGQYDKAVPVLEKALSLAAPSPLLQLHLGQALVRSGNSARGKELLQRAVDSKADLPRIEEARAMLAQS
jgi:predicted Zn-dependent protease